DDFDNDLAHGAPTFADFLQAAGYATGYVGKKQFGYHPPWLPAEHGFDEFRGNGPGNGVHHPRTDGSGVVDGCHNNEIDMQSGYTADLLTRAGIEFIEQHRDQPFCVYVPHLAIHFPWQGTDDPPQRKEGINYADDKWGIIPDPA